MLLGKRKDIVLILPFCDLEDSHTQSLVIWPSNLGHCAPPSPSR